MPQSSRTRVEEGGKGGLQTQPEQRLTFVSYLLLSQVCRQCRLSIFNDCQFNDSNDGCTRHNIYLRLSWFVFVTLETNCINK